MGCAAQFDTDHDGQINYEEFARGIMEEKLLAPPLWLVQ